LYAAARAQLLKTKVKETLDWGWFVIADRCVVSSLAYQWYARWVWIDKVMSINRQATIECLPDVIIYLEADIEKSLERTFDADWDKFETFGKWFFLKVDRWYRQVSKMNEFRQQRHVVDASWTIEEVHARIRKVLSSYWVM
jgi:dTMP kinase